MEERNGRYIADIGSLKISVPGGSSFMFGNGLGDGEFDFHVVTERADIPDGCRCEGCFQIEKPAYIMAYDCGADKAEGGELEPGAYIVESNHGDMYLWKLEDNPKYWGGNLD